MHRLGRTCLAFLAPLVGACLAAGPGLAKVADPDPNCERYESTWTASEQMAWSAICRSGEAVLSNVTLGAGLTKLGDADQQAAVLTSPFLTAVLTQSPYRDYIKGRGLKIRGALFLQALQLNDVAVEGPIFFLNCQFRGPIDLRRSRFSQSVSFVGSEVQAELDARGADIGGSLEMGGSDETSPTPPGSARDVVMIEGVRARHARIGGGLNITDAKIQKGIDFFQVRVAGSINIFRVETHEINLAASEIVGQLGIVDSHLYETPSVERDEKELYALLNLNFLHASQDVFLNRSHINGPTQIEGAKLGGGFYLLGTTLGSMDARGIEIKGSFKVGLNVRPAGIPSPETTWLPNSKLDLRNARLGEVFVTGLNLEYWPGAVDFTNFHIERFDLNSQSTSRTREAERRRWFKSWLALQQNFSPQPYSHVRSVLADAGDYLTSATVGYAGRDRELKESFRQSEIPYGLYLFFSKIFIGYGYQMWLAVIWAVGFICVGAAIFVQSDEGRREHFRYGVSYSFDMFLPLIKLRDWHYDIDLKSKVRYYFYIHKIAGWVFGSFILAGLSGFTK